MTKLIVFCLLANPALGQIYNPVAEERAPESIQQLPEGVRQDLVKRGCVIPKYKEGAHKEDEAYVMSHFRSGASVDYAVVCHIPSRRVQNVLVYSNSKGAWRGEVIDRGGFRSFTQRRQM